MIYENNNIMHKTIMYRFMKSTTDRAVAGLSNLNNLAPSVKSTSSRVYTSGKVLIF